MDIIKNKWVLLLFLILLKLPAHSDTIVQKLASDLFNNVEEVLILDNGELWGQNLRCPIILVERNSRLYYATDSVPIESCYKVDYYYSGTLPITIPISSTSKDISGVRFSMVNIDKDTKNDSNLTITAIHEMYHVFQDNNNLSYGGYSNSHLDKKQGRILLKLELLALEKALESNNYELRKEKLIHALAFRNKRQVLFINAKINEDNFELHEGLPKYTEKMVHRNDSLFSNHLLRAIKIMQNMRSSFSRYYGYTVGATYAILNDDFGNWRKDIKNLKSLSDLTMKNYKIEKQDIDTSLFNKYSRYYDYKRVISQEDSIENDFIKRKDDIYDKLNNGIVLKIATDSISFSFSGMLYLNDSTIYFSPNFSVTGNFGTILCKNGAVKTNKFYYLLLNNKKLNKSSIEALLTDGYKLVKKDGRTFVIESKR